MTKIYTNDYLCLDQTLNYCCYNLMRNIMTYTHRHIQYIEKGEDRREGWRGGGRRNEGKDGEEEEGGVKRGVERRRKEEGRRG